MTMEEKNPYIKDIYGRNPSFFALNALQMPHQ